MLAQWVSFFGALCFSLVRCHKIPVPLSQNLKDEDSIDRWAGSQPFLARPGGLCTKSTFLYLLECVPVLFGCWLSTLQPTSFEGKNNLLEGLIKEIPTFTYSVEAAPSSCPCVSQVGDRLSCLSTSTFAHLLVVEYTLH